MITDYTFRMVRVFDAPVALVWKAWTDKDMAGKWFGPKGCKLSYKTLNVTSGGDTTFSIEFNGMAMYGLWRYLEVVEQKKLVSIVAFTDESVL